MTAPTHITFAEFIYLLILTTMGIALNLVNALVIAISSLLPDIDTAASTAGRLLPFISTGIERRFGHRTLTHSALWVAGMAVVMLPVSLLSGQVYACFIVGYVSHLLLDTMTVNGVKLFYPFSTVKCVFPLEVNTPHRYRVQTGGRADKTLAVIFFIGCIPTFLVSFQGYERFIRATQQNIEAAVRDYNEFSRDHLVHAEVNAYNMMTKEPLRGTVEVVGALNSHTLVFRGADRRLHTLGKEFQADYVAENVLCDPGAPARSYTRSVDVSNQFLSQTTGPFGAAGECYFFGDLTTTDRISLPEHTGFFNPVTGRGEVIGFTFATPGDIRDLNLEYAFISKGMLTVRVIVPQGGERGGAGDTLRVSAQEHYLQFSVLLEAGETIDCLKQRGDTVCENEVIARKNQLRFFGDQIRLGGEKIRLAEREMSASAAEFDRRIADAEQTAGLDSASWRRETELFRSGYVPEGIVRIAEARWQKSRGSLSRLRLLRERASDKFETRMRQLAALRSELEAKNAAAEMKSRILSPAGGILEDIRKIHRENREQVVFIVKRTG